MLQKIISPENRGSLSFLCFFSVLFLLVATTVYFLDVENFNLLIYHWIVPENSRIDSGFTSFMRFTSNLGQWYIYGSVALGLTLISRWRYRYGIPLVVVLVSTASFNLIVKHALMIERPTLHRLAEASGYGFPSGHAMNGIAFIGCFIALLYLHQSIFYGRLALLFGSLFIALVGYSRIYLGVHNPTDIIGAYLLGSAFVFIGLIVARVLKQKKSAP